MAWSTKVASPVEALPFWAKGRISVFAFEALKLCKEPYGYTGKPATMRKLADKGYVRQIGSGAYVVTEEGIDLIEGRCRSPAGFNRREANPYYPDDYGYSSPPRFEPGPHSSRPPQQGATEMAPAVPATPLPYTTEPVTGGCQVIRPRFGSGRRLRPVT